ncbi:hypothetical protein MMC18_002202 [Xylographa bjoerkii]|nr:hypothetical protein [Xylographa bjoerkii]
MSLQIQETDESGAQVATYVTSRDGQGIARVDMIDSLQAFSSSIAGLLSSRAVLEGVGVGDANASPTAALLLSVLQDSMGRIATILFAHKLGTALEPECKMYRLLADVFNDIAMVLDCLSPALPKVPRVMLLSVSSVLRALCGVAAGSSKASLSAHFAKWGNLGELNAKDSSQETIISLLGMLAGSLVVSYVKSPIATWSWLILLLSIHLAMNHAAVRAVSLHTLNRQRANIVISTMLDQNKALTPDEVSVQERIFERDGVLRWRGTRIIGKAIIGVSLQRAVGFLGQPHSVTGSVRSPSVELERLVNMFQDEEYLLWYERSRHLAMIVLKEQASPQSQLKGWSHALLMAQRHASEDTASAKPKSMGEETLQRLQETLREMSVRWKQSLIVLEESGWDLNTASLETTSSTRIHLQRTTAPNSIHE